METDSFEINPSTSLSFFQLRIGSHVKRFGLVSEIEKPCSPNIVTFSRFFSWYVDSLYSSPFFWLSFLLCDVFFSLLMLQEIWSILFWTITSLTAEIKQMDLLRKLNQYVKTAIEIHFLSHVLNHCLISLFIIWCYALAFSKWWLGISLFNNTFLCNFNFQIFVYLGEILRNWFIWYACHERLN